MIIAVFPAVQIYSIWFAANGPFIDESLYTVAGMSPSSRRSAITSEGYPALSPARPRGGQLGGLRRQLPRRDVAGGRGVQYGAPGGVR